ncbi:MAG: hypothetical protein FWG02_02385 [Holophagaceae bacterium]|nr:hypothetical protein [Holophagaceae bacterium]
MSPTIALLIKLWCYAAIVLAFVRLCFFYVAVIVKNEGASILSNIIPVAVIFCSIIGVVSAFHFEKKPEPPPVVDTNSELLHEVRELRHDIEILKEQLKIHTNEHLTPETSNHR